MRRAVAPLAAVVVAVLVLGSCTASGPGTYTIVARFRRAVALYVHSDVKVMGITVGHVRRIAIDGDEIVVTLSIRKDVPLPADATVGIEPSSLIGERNVVLPPWKPGDARLAAGTVIGADRTIIPVEPDEALQAVTDLVGALDPKSVNDLVTATAGAVAGKGETINQAIAQLGQLLPFLSQQDDKLLAIAGDVHRLSAVVQAREAEIGRLLDEFSSVAGVLDQERADIVAFVKAMVQLTEQGKALLTAYQATLPKDLNTIGTIALTIKANAEAVRQLLPNLSSLNVTIVDAYDGQHMAIRGRGPAERSALEQLLPILDQLAHLPCLPTPGVTCQ